MFDVFSRSWAITKLSFGIIGKDKEILLFPLFGGIFSILFALVMIYPTIIVQQLESTGDVQFGPLQFAVLFAVYFGLAFIATFFNVCTVYTTKIRLEGGDATFGESLRFGFSKISLIAGWSFVSASVGMFFRLLDYAAQNAGAAGEVIINIITSLLGLLWSVITIFVVPAMVYNDLGPVDAIKASTRTIKETWGESLVRHYGLGMMQFLFLLLGVLLVMGLFATIGKNGGTGGVIALVLGISYFIAVVLVFSAANMVFNTILYAYADGNTIPAEVDTRLMDGAFRTR